MIALLFSLTLAGVRPFPDVPPVTIDTDDVPVDKAPAPMWVSTDWEAIAGLFFRPVLRALKVEKFQPSVNVNSMDTVPDSTWFRTKALPSPAAMGRGACDGVPKPKAPFMLRLLRENPSAVQVTDANGKNWIFRVDETLQPERASTSSIVISRVLHGLGYNTACVMPAMVARKEFDESQVLSFDKRGAPQAYDDMQLVDFLAEGYRVSEHVRVRAILEPDGNYLGGWALAGERPDDPNDAIPHELRRDLRGLKFVAAWLGWVFPPPEGTADFFQSDQLVHHFFLDPHGGLGLAVPDVPSEFNESIGTTYVFDAADIGVNLFTFGAVRRPPKRSPPHPDAENFGNYPTLDFELKKWKPLFPVEAWVQARPADLAWMARITADWTPEHIARIVDAAELDDPATAAVLKRSIWRRLKTAQFEAFERAGPFGLPTLVDNVLRWRSYHLGDSAYVSAYSVTRDAPVQVIALGHSLVLPSLTDDYLVIDIAKEEGAPAMRVHLASDPWRIVGVERVRHGGRF